MGAKNSTVIKAIAQDVQSLFSATSRPMYLKQRHVRENVEELMKQTSVMHQETQEKLHEQKALLFKDLRTLAQRQGQLEQQVRGTVVFRRP